jgi:cob(I)alamin adenosyltransferase
LIQIYTGNGKGKTTACLGLALRAQGAGLKVFIGQFIKRGHYSELAAIKKLPNIKVNQFGREGFIVNKATAKDLALAKNGLNKVAGIIAKKTYDLIILDEINVAIRLKLIKLKEILELIKSIPQETELILTGRYAHPRLLKIADLVSEIKERKHYFKKGKKARKGIEF